MGHPSRRRVAAMLLVATVWTGACSGGGGDDLDVDAEATVDVTSTDLTDGEPVPVRFTCDGDDAAPTLAWSGVPEGTVEVVVVVDDPDAPRGTFTHWTVWGLAPDDAPVGASLPADAVEGATGFGTVGYRGPCPPPGDDPHRYRFRVIAVDAPVTLERGASADALADALDGHALAEGHLQATYGR